MMVLIIARLIRNIGFRFLDIGIPTGWWHTLIQQLMNALTSKKYYQNLYNHNYMLGLWILQIIMTQIDPHHTRYVTEESSTDDMVNMFEDEMDGLYETQPSDSYIFDRELEKSWNVPINLDTNSSCEFE